MHRPRTWIPVVGSILALGACSHYPYDYPYETYRGDVSRSGASTADAPGVPTGTAEAASGRPRVVDSFRTRDAAAPYARRTVPAAVGTIQQDYSISGMFDRSHGDFMLNRQPFREDIRVSWYSQFGSEVKGEAGHFDIHQIELDALVDFAIDPDSYLSVGARGGNKRYDFSPTAPVDGDEDLGEVTLRFGGGHFVHEDLLISGLFEPGLYSDFEGTLTSDDWQFYGNVLGTWRQREDLFWKIGLLVSNDFEDLDVVPLLGVSWLPAESWRIDVLVPKLIEVSWLPSAYGILAAGLELEGDEYATRSPSSSGKQRFTQEVQEIRLYGRGTYRFDDMYSGFVKGGITVAGDYEWNTTMGPYDGVLEPSFFLEVGLGIDF